MGSQAVYVYSVDDARFRAALGSGDRELCEDWLRVIRRRAGSWESEDVVRAQEEAAERLVAGGAPPGGEPEACHFGYAFLALCEEWADRKAAVECYVTEKFPALWGLAAGAGPNPFWATRRRLGAGHVGWHEPSAVPGLRRAFAAVRAGDPALARFGGTAQNLAALDVVLAHAEAAGRGVVVSWAT